jgi:polyketide synthase
VSWPSGSQESRAGPLRGATCLVTGATGFIGGHLVRRLAAHGCAVRCLVRAGSDTAGLEQSGLELARGDLRDPGSLAGAVAGCEYVVHCAALVSDWATTAEIVASNVDGTRHLLAACRNASVGRIVHLSSTDVYGHPGLPSVDEAHVGGRFRNWYAQSKKDAEVEVRRAADAYGAAAVILRPATVYGPGSKDVVGEIARALRARHMLLIDGGRAVAGLCYVENLLDAVVLALGHPQAVGQAFNISDGLPVTWRRFTDDLARSLGCPPARFSLPYPLAEAIGFGLEHAYRLLRRSTGIELAPLLSRQAVQVLGVDQDFDNRKARELLGWEPRVGYEAGLEATIDWLQRPGRIIPSG